MQQNDSVASTARRIVIDGVDIATLGLRRLRGAIAMLPQVSCNTCRRHVRCHSSTLPLPFINLSLPSIDPSLPFRCLSSTFHCLFAAFHRPFTAFSLPFIDFSLPFRCLPSTLHCLFTAFRRPSTAFSPPFNTRSLGSDAIRRERPEQPRPVWGGG